MMAEADPILRAGANEARAITLTARPEALRLDPAETAVVVIDMQNAYATEGGYVDLAGFDIAGSASVIGRIAQVLDTARAAGMPVVFLQNGLVDCQGTPADVFGGAGSDRFRTFVSRHAAG